MKSCVNELRKRIATTRCYHGCGPLFWGLNSQENLSKDAELLVKKLVYDIVPRVRI